MYRTERRPQDQQRDARERDQDEYRGERDLARSGQSGSVEQQDDWNQRQSSGKWTGYVVPYRYYGPGYAGTGYYSVMYQGTDEGGESPRGQFDQREVDYGQGQGAGAAWTGNRRSSAGGQAGRGPKGYQRSDGRIEEEVSDRLMADDWIDASGIEVRVKNAEVTLTGTVGDRQAKRRAEDVAEQVLGVRDVMNQIRVEPESSTARQSGSARQSSSSRQSGSTRSSAAASSSRRSSRNGGRATDQGTTSGGTSQTDSTTGGTR